MKIIFTKKIFFYLILLILTLSYIQVQSTPFSFIQEAEYLSAPYGLKGFIKAGIYISIYFFAIISIGLALLVRSKFLAGLLIAFFALAYGVDFFIQSIGSNNTGISKSVLTLAITEASRAGDMWLFRTDIFKSLGVVIGVILLALLVRFVFLKTIRIHSILGVLLIILAASLSWLASANVFSIVNQSFPAPIKLLSISTEYALEKEPPARVLEANVKPEKAAQYRSIMWLIDESVGGQYLSVNGFKKETTPFLDKLAQTSPDFKNFGVVPSISNCSGPSNLLLRIGLTNKKSSIFEKNLEELPTIFEYAQRAGYETYLIDAQIAEGELQNHLTANDLKAIDHYITFGREFLPNMRDKEALRVLAEINKKEDKVKRFIVVVKWGSHWPYAEAYPDEAKVFKPASSDFYTKMTEENKERILNSYYNSLRYSTNNFLQELVKDDVLNDNIIFYTSDHGQNLYQNNGITLTHCNQTSVGQKPVMEAFRVPLMVFAKDAKKLFANENKNEMAQEQIFPTILGMMGYGDKLVNQYGPTLFEKPKERKVREIFSTTRYFDYKP